LQELAQAAAYIEDQVFFFQAIRADRAGVVASVAGVDYDFSDL